MPGEITEGPSEIPPITSKPAGDPVIKYARENIADPQDVFRSPTEALRPWLQEACVRLNDLVFVEAYDLAHKKGILNPDDPPVVRVGRELELLLFSDQFDSTIDQKGDPFPKRENPNYTEAHKAEIARLRYDIMRGRSEGGLGYLLEPGRGFAMMGQIIGEMRARPTTVAGYIKDTDIIEQYMREQSEARGIRPVVLANHLHVSVTDSHGGTNLLATGDVERAVQRGVMDAYHRLLPLSRLPEEVDTSEFDYYSTVRSNQSAKMNGEGTSEGGDGPKRIEGRLNSTEYMYDPYMTLFVNLLGVYRGLRYASDPSKIDEDYPLQVDPERGHLYFTNRATDARANYAHAVEYLLDDKVLREHLRPGVIYMLHRSFRDYWNISTGKKSVSQVRRETERVAKRYARVRPPKQFIIG